MKILISMVLTLAGFMTALSSPINTQVRSITANGDHVEMSLSGNATIYVNTNEVLPQTSDTAFSYFFHDLSMDTTFSVVFPSGGGTFWLIPFDDTQAPVKISSYGSAGVTVECPCSAGAIECDQEFTFATKKFRCKQGLCTGQCSLLTKDNVNNLPISNGPGTYVEATTIVYNGVTYS